MERLKNVEESLREAGYRFSYDRIRDAMKSGEIRTGYGEGGIHVDLESALKWAEEHCKKATRKYQRDSKPEWPLFERQYIERIAKALEDIAAHLAKWN